MAAPMKDTRFTRLVLGLLEPIVLQRRRGTLIVLGLITLFLAWQASLLKPQAGWLKIFSHLITLRSTAPAP